ncbi:MAG: ABC transporter ATP-binding protein/permease [Defluviitaleaceae bacterium]|nr:ABC transporter ATP-binding protein/permease [Defluviitaleaceae bacterium]
MKCANFRMFNFRMFRLFFRAFGYMKPMRKLYLLGITLASFEMLMLFAMPEINRMLVQMVTIGSGDVLRRIVLIMIGLLALTPFVAYGNYIIAICTQNISNNLKKSLFAHIQRLPIKTLAEKQSGDYLMRLSGDADWTGNLFGGFIMTALLRFAVVTIIAMTLLALTDWRMLILCALYSLICFAIAAYLNPIVQRLERASRKEISLSSNILLETMRALPIVRVFMIVPALAERYRVRCENVRANRAHYRTVSGIGYGTIDFFVFSAQAVGFIAAIFLLTRGEMELYAAVYTASLMALASDAMLQLSTFILWSQQAFVAADRIFEIIDEPCEKNIKSEKMPNKNAEEALRLENVSFSYPDGTTALKNINLVIKNGENIAFAGGSGGGKTTLAQIIASLYEPTDGEITFYGEKISDLSLTEIRKLISYVPQEPILFEGTIYENIALGKPNATESEIKKAAQNAHLEEFIQTLPQGYHTQVGERGTQLSGGQRQRIAIAHAILKDAPLLILDEASSALDSDTEDRVQQSLDKFAKNRTTITVAHRLSTIANADRILTLEDGEIIATPDLTISM